MSFPGKLFNLLELNAIVALNSAVYMNLLFCSCFMDEARCSLIAHVAEMHFHLDVVLTKIFWKMFRLDARRITKNYLLITNCHGTFYDVCTQQ